MRRDEIGQNPDIELAQTTESGDSWTWYQAILAQEVQRIAGLVYVAPEVLNPTTSGDMDRIAALKAVAKEKTRTLPFKSAINEYLELQGKLARRLEEIGLSPQANKDQLEFGMKASFIKLIHTFDPEFIISSDELSSLLAETSIFKDRAKIIERLFEFQGTEKELFRSESRYIWNQSEQDLTVYASQRLIETLQMTRFLGLIPFESLAKLRRSKIVVLGASVAASTLELLAALGVAAQIEFIDDGELEPSNGPRMPAGKTSDYRSNGQPKVFALADILFGRNPYGQFIPHRGRVVFSEEEKRPEKDDRTLSELVTDDVAFVVEVVDGPREKTRVRLEMEQHHPQIPIVFPADVGNNAFTGLEDSAAGNYFNQSLTPAQQEFIRRVANKGLASLNEAEKTLLLIVGNQLPAEHKLQVISGPFGGIEPWLSQTPIAARQSAAVGASAMLWHLSTGEGLGKNLTFQNGLSSLQPPFSPEAKKILDKINSLVTQ
ncbi:MAG: hypothetical protein COY81_05445 [Candidatus Pacebacteria bacterium CG_4_10_14_0_8_um_filter_43_12]|nr:MAG: hypothetical protein COY81_05445 [Candidatus Pacebacteria bacterium CG_4_10_14_0_8_um_filter_43_12]